MKLACVIVVLSVIFNAGCEKTMYTRGYSVDFSDFKSIRVGKDDAQAVFDKVGSPSIRSSVEDEKGQYSWYYVTKKTEKNGFLDPKVIEQKTVEISFDASGIVSSVKERRGENKIEIVKDVTETSGKGTGIANEILGGLGKYRKRYQDN